MNNQNSLIEDILRYSKQVVLKTMDAVRSNMRGSDRLVLKEVDPKIQNNKANDNLTKTIDSQTEDLIINSIKKKFSKLSGISGFTIFSEECGIQTIPQELDKSKSEWVIFVDPIDGTEFIESLQGGWCLLAVYNRKMNQCIAVVAGDIFLNRLYWASNTSVAECLDFATHSWFKLDGGPSPKKNLKNARINFLTTKASRFMAVANQTRFITAVTENDARLNLSWGSNMLVQVAAGYADAAVEFNKGFATYDVLPGIFLGEKAGLTIIDLQGKPITSQLDLDHIFNSYERDSQHPVRIPFIAAKEPDLAYQIRDLLE